MKIYSFKCDYEHSMDNVCIIAKTKEDAVGFLSHKIE